MASLGTDNKEVAGFDKGAGCRCESFLFLINELCCLEFVTKKNFVFFYFFFYLPFAAVLYEI